MDIKPSIKLAVKIDTRNINPFRAIFYRFWTPKMNLKALRLVTLVSTKQQISPKMVEALSKVKYPPPPPQIC